MRNRFLDGVVSAFCNKQAVIVSVMIVAGFFTLGLSLGSRFIARGAALSRNGRVAGVTTTSVTPVMASDYDQDGRVSLGEVAKTTSFMTGTVFTPSERVIADADGNGKIDKTDVSAAQSNYLGKRPYQCGLLAPLSTDVSVLRLRAALAEMPVRQIIHADQVDVPLFALQVLESGNAENLTLQRFNFAVANGDNNFQNFKLFKGGVQIGTTTQPVRGEVRFNNINLPILKGASPTVLMLKASATTSGVQKIGQQSSFAPTFYEYVGQTTGVVTKISGGVTRAISNKASAIPVNDIQTFAVGSRVAIDLDNDGVVSGTKETNGNDGYTIVALSNMGSQPSITINTPVTVTVPGGRIISFDDGKTGMSVGTTLNFQSNILISHNVEPVVIANSVATTGVNGSENQPIATFSIKADGGRDMIIAGLQFKFVGSFVGNGKSMAGRCVASTGGGIFDVQVWQNAEKEKRSGTLYRRTAVGGSGTCFASGEVASFRFEPPLLISAGNVSDIIIKANTSQTRVGVVDGAVTYGITLDGVSGQGQIVGGGASVETKNALGGLLWDYTGVDNRYGSTGTTQVGNPPNFTNLNAEQKEVMDVSDSYPVQGPIITY